jgi:hypothetical protein
MELPRRVRATAGRLGWGVLVTSLALLGSDATGQNTTDDGIPSGIVAFFAGSSCPAGWTRPDYAKGRMVVAVVDGATVGTTVGTPLGDREDRTHQHDYSVSVQLQGRGLTGLAGGSPPGAQAQTYTIEGESDPASSDLPFVQLLPCERQ